MFPTANEMLRDVAQPTEAIKDRDGKTYPFEQDDDLLVVEQMFGEAVQHENKRDALRCFDQPDLTGRGFADQRRNPEHDGSGDRLHQGARPIKRPPQIFKRAGLGFIPKQFHAVKDIGAEHPAKHDGKHHNADLDVEFHAGKILRQRPPRCLGLAHHPPLVYAERSFEFINRRSVNGPKARLKTTGHEGTCVPETKTAQHGTAQGQARLQGEDIHKIPLSSIEDSGIFTQTLQTL